MGFPLFQRKRRFHTQFAYCACCLCAAVIVPRATWERGGSIESASPAIVALNMQINIFYLQCTIMFNRILMRHGTRP